MKVASVDIGSNTTLFLAVEKNENGFSILEDEIYFTRLAEGIEKNKKLSERALARLEEAFRSIREKLDHWNIDQTLLVATSASRQAQNKDRLFELAEKYKLKSLQIISPEEEARLTYLGAFFGLKQESQESLVVDIGGGSTEFVSSDFNYSLKIGSVSLTEKFLTTNALLKSEEKNLLQFIKQQIHPLKSVLNKKYKQLIFVAGTPVTLAFMEHKTSDPNAVHGLLLNEETVDFWISRLAKLSVKERKKLSYLPEHRADVIISGLFILKEILKETCINQFVVSVTGVRYGLILGQKGL